MLPRNSSASTNSLPDANKWFFAGGRWYISSSDGRRSAISHGERFAVADREELIADIMGAQERLQHLFAYDRSDPLFSSHLTLSQLRIVMLLARHGSVSGGELARMLGVGLATMSGMVDRLVVQDLVTRTEDQHDRRIRRIGLTKAGTTLIGSIFNAGEEKMRALLSRLSAEELALVTQATLLLVKAAEEQQQQQSGES